ncbi:unnamed protein product [Cuscuta campestris]|uniref:Uncharacterized protein n=1 Tax=Cuscuta campestris TaxID=132261 RepID=A0A484LXP2_9ASTE|nr:unnamed protein product [Cuscuta campestris]
MDKMSIPHLDPPKALLERAFELPLHSVCLIGSNPLLPLHLRRVTQNPPDRRRFPFLVLEIILPAAVVGFVVRV